MSKEAFDWYEERSEGLGQMFLWNQKDALRIQKYNRKFTGK